MKKQKIVAVLLAAGEGKRFGSDIPKQFVTVNGKSMVLYAMDTFNAHPMIDEILVVCHAGYLSFMDEIRQSGKYEKFKHLIKGGKERYLSTLCALQYLVSQKDTKKTGTTYLLLHDAARPRVSESLIREIVEASRDSAIVVPVVPATDTIYKVNAKGILVEIPNRDTLFHAQTPQLFKAEILQAAFDKALLDPLFSPTDDASMVFHYLPQEQIQLVQGDPANSKITQPEDLSPLFST
ncbi:MAG: 2-C-methyl-D-erythritol 4-phosphate cytidylyltransferase [Bacteroidales bacterium]|nr:2-C-methyl-D-erythritol 4-phosphate cytidylyltransferase [Bacteroidales bacterium]